jgi:hypothetical protein
MLELFIAVNVICAVALLLFAAVWLAIKVIRIAFWTVVVITVAVRQGVRELEQ